MTPRGGAARQALLDWAAGLDLPVTSGQVDELLPVLVAAVKADNPRLAAAVRVPKAGATPDDARRIAARLEASMGRLAR